MDETQETHETHEKQPLLKPLPAPRKGIKRIGCLVCVIFCSCVFILVLALFILAFFIFPGDEPIRVTPIGEAIDVPDAPDPVQLISQNILSIKIKWNEPDFHLSVISEYQVQYLQTDLINANWTTHLPGPGINLVYEVTNLLPGKDYSFRVRAVNEVGPGNYSNPSGFQTLNATEPGEPSAAFISYSSDSSLSIRWDEGESNGATIVGFELQSQNIDQYFYQESESENDNENNNENNNGNERGYKKSENYQDEWQTVYEGSEKYFILGGLFSDTFYKFRVRTISLQGPSNWSEISEYHTDSENVIEPESPYNITLEKAFCDSLHISWIRPNDGGSEIISYKIFVSDGKVQEVIRNPTSQVERATIHHLKASYDYSIEIISVTTTLQSKNPNAFGARTLDPSAPLPPNPPIVTAASANTITLSWKEPINNCDNISNYILERDDWWFDLPFQSIYQGLNKSFTEDDLLPATTYNFRVSAQNKAGSSSFSQSTSMKTFTQGACGNEEDVRIVKENFDTMQGIIQGCLIRCAIGGTECALNCIMNELGLSEDCSYCWVDMGLCTLNKCTTECLRPSSQACFRCTEEKCFPDTVICTGMPQWSFPPT